MGLPAGLATVRLHCDEILDPAGTPVTGTLYLYPPGPLTWDGQVLLTAVPITVDVTDGALDVTLPANDDPGLSATGWTWRIREGWPGGRLRVAALPSTTPDVDYASLAEADFAGGVLAPTALSVNGHTGAVILGAADVGADPAGSAAAQAAAAQAAAGVYTDQQAAAAQAAAGAYTDTQILDSIGGRELAYANIPTQFPLDGTPVTTAAETALTGLSIAVTAGARPFTVQGGVLFAAKNAAGPNPALVTMTARLYDSAGPTLIGLDQVTVKAALNELYFAKLHPRARVVLAEGTTRNYYMTLQSSLAGFNWTAYGDAYKIPLFIEAIER